jgi:hypothetical protein
MLHAGACTLINECTAVAAAACNVRQTCCFFAKAVAEHKQTAGHMQHIPHRAVMRCAATQSCTNPHKSFSCCLTALLSSCDC